MKATPIAKYLDQRPRAEPVAWPPVRQEASPFKPKPALAQYDAPAQPAPAFRRATLFDTVDSRARELADRRSPSEPDGRRRDSIFARSRDPAPPPPPPQSDIEERLAEAYHRGVQEGLDAANAEAAKARALERAEIQKRSVVERLDFQMNEFARLSETISTGLVEVEQRIADVVARILQPFVTKQVSREIIDELVENIARLRGGGEVGLMRITGPERVLSALKKRVSQIAVDVEYVDEDRVEVTVEAQHTTIRSEFGPWAELIASIGERD